MPEYSLEPVDVKKVSTRYRTIQTRIPVPESLAIFESLKKSEPRSMLGMPPVVWDRAENFTVYDKWGNRWIDWSSCVLLANAGHGREEIKAALKEQIDQGLLATYVFVHEKRAKLTKALQDLSPDPANYEAFLLSTGSEAIENCIKLAKTYALEKHGPDKKYIISFENAFHGRTLGAQLVGGNPRLKKWIGTGDPTFVQVPFPDGYHVTDTSFDLFRKSIEDRGLQATQIAGVLTESYQGGCADFLPVTYARDLETFCRSHDIVTIYDEIQAGFGRTGKMFCYEHYGVQPDLIACGKGISSSLPIAAVIGRADIMDLYAPGSMTSTHSASPLCVAAALASLKILQGEDLIANAARMGEILIPELERIRNKYPKILAVVHGQGLVAGIRVADPKTKKPDGETALKINTACYQKGLLMFAPVGSNGECVKIAPPLTITEEALREGIDVFEEALNEVLN
ncbi:MAG: aminotransferase class III-fold pyridoxal phosphate-dependent enzyme [Desulfobacterales bacterium]|nr:aminotransferase class III-fold pyridoxal phosphate-dependent enzyme [Desulfobacterales bacterium]